MHDLGKIRQRHLLFMHQTLDILTHVLVPVSQSTATTLRDGHDGPSGWTVVEVVCHLRDFDTIFRTRAEMIRDQENPQETLTLPTYDHEALALAGNYNHQELSTVLAQLTTSRLATIAFFKPLNRVQWERAAIHPERGRFTMTDALIQIGMHDVTHLEQITRILFQNDE